MTAVMQTVETKPEALTNLRKTLNDSVVQILKPRPRFSGSEWANRNMVLSAETATEPGQFRWERAPFQKEMIDTICDDHTQKVVLMTAARVGKTTVMKAGTGYFMSSDPASIMWMLPTLGLADSFSQTEIDPLIRDTRVIRDLVRDKRSRDSGNNKLQKKYKGGVLHLIGAESVSGLHGKTIRVLFADEVDRFAATIADGDPLQLAMVRTTTFGHRRKIVLSSTPTYKDLSHIESHFKDSDQRYYQVPCPACKTYQKLTWKNLNFSDDIDNPVYVCNDCGYCIPESQKFNMLREGKWVAENPGHPVAGFHLNALYSVHMSWKEMVKEFQEAKHNRFKLQVFVNSRLAETWDESGDRISTHQLEQRLEQYNAPFPTYEQDICNGAGLLTAGVDVQGNRLEIAVWGHGAGDELWLVDTHIIDGDTGTDAPWMSLATFIYNQRYRTKNGGQIGIRSIAIDSGHNTERVYRFVNYLRSHDTAGRVFLATKGVQQANRFIADRPSQSKQHNALFYPVGTDLAKDHLSSLLMNTTAGQNYVHLPVSFPSEDGQPRWIDKEILSQLTSEKPVLTYKKGVPKREWRKVRERNEQWDMMILAYAAMLHLGPNVLRDLGVLAQKAAALQPDPNSIIAKPAPLPHSTVPAQQNGLMIHRPKVGGSNRDFWSR